MIADYFISKNVSVYQAAKDADIPYATLNDLVLEKTDIKKTSAQTLYRLAKYLGVSMEQLYEAREITLVFSISNEGSKIIIVVGKNRFEYVGPKNLIAFNRINKVSGNVIYVDALFDLGGEIASEEEYIDLNHILGEYNMAELLKQPYRVEIKTKIENKTPIEDIALLVSDYLAIVDVENSTDEIWLEIISTVRQTQRMKLRLSDYVVLSTNMSVAMQKRALAAVKRNKELILEAIEEKYA